MCDPPNDAVSACDFRRCDFRCDLEHADCNGEAGDGCEVYVVTNPNHCGHCGNVCPIPLKCVGSRCQ